MVEKGYISYPQYSGELEKDKIAFFKKIKTKDVDTISVIFDDTAPDIVKQAALFLNKSQQGGFEMALKGLYLVKHKSVISKEYIKDGKDWILYVELTTKENGGLEDTLLGDSNFKFAVGQLDGINYIAFEGAQKVFIMQNKFTASFGYIDMEELSEYINSLPDKQMYLLDNMNESAYLVDAPAQLFAHDNVFYRDGDFIGMWISFGTFLKYDLQNLNEVNIDGLPVSIVDSRLDRKTMFKKILENKAAGYASLIVDLDSMLTYLLKQSKQYILDKTKMDATKICTDSVLYNLQNKGILGIVYEEVYSIKDMYIPAFDYTTASVKEIIDSAIVFIYEDEYIWMNYSAEDKEIRFVTYKGEVHEFSDNDICVTLYNDVTLTRINKVNPDNFVLFTGFPNLDHNSVVDFYFDNTTEVMNSKNSKFSIDINAFDDFYKDKTSSFNKTFNKPNELVKTYGANKYLFETGLVHYEPHYDAKLDKEVYKLSVKTQHSFKTLIDVPSKRAYISSPVLNNYGGEGYSTFEPTADSFYAYLKQEVFPEDIKPNPITGKKSFVPVDALDYVFNFSIYSNGWVTLKDKKHNKYVSLFAERDIYQDFVFGSYLAEVQKKVDLLKAQKQAGQDVDLSKAANELRVAFQFYFKSLCEFKANEAEQVIAKKVRICSDKYRYEFDKKSDDMYVNNVPTSEIANHAILFEDVFKANAQKSIKFKTDIGVMSPYIKLATLTTNEDNVSIEVKEDNSGDDYTILFPDAGIIAKQGFDAPQIQNLEYKYKMMFENDGIQNIDGTDMHIYRIRYGAKVKINIDKINEMAKQLVEQSNLSQYKSEKAKADEERAEITKKIHNPITNPKTKHTKERVVSELSDFFEFGVPALIAYAQGKILVSIDGSDWYEPFYTDNGLRLNMNMYVSDIDAFELILQNLSITDYTFQSFSGIMKKVDLVDLNQIKLHNITIDKEFTKAYVDFEFKDVACVYNGILYQPKQRVQAVVDLDKDYDKIVEVTISDTDGNSSDVLRRNVFVIPSIEYQTIYPLDTKYQVTNAEDILNHENCFNVQHDIPLALTLDNDDYLYETKSNALNDGAKMFFNFKAGE